MDMQCIFENLLISSEEANIQDEISKIIFIASLTRNTLDSLEVETVSKICSVIYKKIYGNDFSAFKAFLSNEIIKIDLFTIRICNKPLWNAIWLNSIKNFDFMPSRTRSMHIEDHADFLLWCTHFILNNIDILDKNSLYLLRCLQLILNQKTLLSSTPNYLIIRLMSKVALSPQQGFKQLTCSISKTVLQFLKSEQQYELSKIGLLPVNGIETSEIVGIFTDEFVKENLKTITIKVFAMFSNNIENKDGRFLYEKVLICTFEEWVHFVWPHFFHRLSDIEYEGEFFQSLVKYWIPLTIDAYRTEFYGFIELQPIDLRLKAHVLLETIRRGFLLEQEKYVYNHVQTADLGLNIISTFKKKSLHPSNEDIDFLMDFLYSNLKSYLEDNEIDSIKKLFSQVVCVANTDLKKGDKNFSFYADFVQKIYNYCSKCFQTEFFEVGAQVLHNFLNIIKGSHKELKLIHKLEKRDYYETGENFLFIKLKEKGLWKFDDAIFPTIKECLIKTDCYSWSLTNLVSRHYYKFSFMNPDLFKNIIRKVEGISNLLNSEKIVNCSNLLFSQEVCKETLLFVEEIEECLLKQISIENPDENSLFKQVLHFEIITFAKKRQFKVKNIDEIIKRSLILIDRILESNFLQDISYRCKKVLETFMTRLMFLITQNLHELWSTLDKEFATKTLIKIIEKSNMKKPVSVSTELLRQFGFKLEEVEFGKIFKIRLLNQTLEAIKEVPTNNYLKIRRNPESRLVIHALCVSQRDSEKPYLHWTMKYLLNMITNSETPDLSMSACLHSIELLICDNRLHQQSLVYIPDIIMNCVELFERSTWIVRNANVQLVKSLIERLYGVSMNNSCRPKNVADLFVLYPNIASYFFKILSLEKLDDRAVIVFQFFSESYIKDSIIDDDISEIMEYFKILLIHIIKTYENQYGKLAVKSFVAICHNKDIPYVFLDIADFIKVSFVKLPKNIFANLVLLLQELYEKYKCSFENQIDPRDLQIIDSSWASLSDFLKQFDNTLFDLLLVKVKSIDEILNHKSFKNNFWVHNNLTFFFLNATSSQICSIFEHNEFSEMPECFQIKMLTILTQRFENNEFSNADLEKITNSLLNISLTASDESCYLLNCYFKCLLLFQENVNIKLEFKMSVSKNIYKNLIILIYAAKGAFRNSNSEFFDLLVNNIKSNISVNEDIDEDILSALTLSYAVFPKKNLVDIFKIVFYYSLLKPSYPEALYFLSKNANKSYTSLLDALNNFCSIYNLRYNLEEEIYVKTFLNDVIFFVNNSYFKNDKHEDEFYIVEDEVLVPKMFIKKLLRCKKCFIKNIENKL